MQMETNRQEMRLYCWHSLSGVAHVARTQIVQFATLASALLHIWQESELVLGCELGLG
jgi:hypothetical protein